MRCPQCGSTNVQAVGDDLRCLGQVVVNVVPSGMGGNPTSVGVPIYDICGRVYTRAQGEQAQEAAVRQATQQYEKQQAQKALEQAAEARARQELGDRRRAFDALPEASDNEVIEYLRGGTEQIPLITWCLDHGVKISPVPWPRLASLLHSARLPAKSSWEHKILKRDGRLKKSKFIDGWTIAYRLEEGAWTPTRRRVEVLLSTKGEIYSETPFHELANQNDLQRILKANPRS